MQSPNLRTALHKEQFYYVCETNYPWNWSEPRAIILTFFGDNASIYMAFNDICLSSFSCSLSFSLPYVVQRCI